MKKGFVYPAGKNNYPYDRGKYNAICRWFGYTPQTFGRTALPEFLYHVIETDLVKEQGQWLFSPKAAAASTVAWVRSQGGHPPRLEELPEQPLEFLLKNIYKGVFFAYGNGIHRTPVTLGIAQHAPRRSIASIQPDHNGDLALYLSLEGMTNYLRALVPLMKEASQQNAVLLRKSAMDLQQAGYRAQCYAHYVHTHPGTADEKAGHEFAEARTREFIKNQMLLN